MKLSEPFTVQMVTVVDPPEVVQRMKAEDMDKVRVKVRLLSLRTTDQHRPGAEPLGLCELTVPKADADKMTHRTVRLTIETDLPDTERMIFHEP